jgi:hypothetical protein
MRPARRSTGGQEAAGRAAFTGRELVILAALLLVAVASATCCGPAD